MDKKKEIARVSIETDRSTLAEAKKIAREKYARTLRAQMALVFKSWVEKENKEKGE